MIFFFEKLTILVTIAICYLSRYNSFFLAPCKKNAKAVPAASRVVAVQK